MSQRNKPPHRPTGYNKNFGYKNNYQRQQPTSGRIVHTRPNRPKYNLQQIRNHLIKDDADVNLESNIEKSGISITTNQNESDRGKHFRRHVTIKDRIKDRVKEMAVDTKRRIAIGEEQTTKPLPIPKPICQIAGIPPIVFQSIGNFVEQYLICFDTNRNALIDAYHMKAIFSFSINMNNETAHNNYRYGDQIKDSRNLNHISKTETEKRYRLVHVNSNDIVKFLNNLQPTEHIKESLKLDVSFFAPHLLTFSVIGVFKEGTKDAKIRPYRAFQRVFVCVPIDQTGRIGIINEQFTISNMSTSQFKNYIKEDKATSLVPEVKIDPELEKKKLIEKFSNDTKLNSQWSRDTLIFVGWDYNKALEAFMNKKELIPQDAYL